MKSCGVIFAGAILTLLPLQSFAHQTDEEIMRMLRSLRERVEQLELQLAQQPHEVEQVEVNAGETEEEKNNFKGVEFHALVEVEAVSGEDHTGDDGSDITLATVELGFDFSVFDDWVSGSVVALHEDDATDKWEVDQAFITVGNPEKYPLYLSAGRMYVPFGNFETSLVSDPLTLEIGETRESAIQLGFEQGNWYGSGYVFNGDLDETGDDQIENYGFNLGYAMQGEGFSFDVGMSWINHLGDSDGIEEAVADTDADGSPGPVSDYISAYGLHGIYRKGPWSIIGEYIKATEEFTAGELPWRSGGAKPGAYNLEFGYDFEAFGGRENKVALALQGTQESVALGLPEGKWLASFSTAIYKNTSLAIEYAHAADYSVKEGGTGKDGDALTMQLAVEL